MKKSLLFCTLAVALMALAGCRKENPYTNGVVGIDDARYLQSSLVFSDEEDNITGYMIGQALNAGDPGEISVVCESVEKAEELFREWIPEKAELLRDGEALVWNMTDTVGVSQGAVKLLPGGNKGAVAHLEMPAKFPSITSVQFLPRAAFPENGELDYSELLDEYYFLNVVEVPKGNSHGYGKFVVIREYDQDTNRSGIIFATSGSEFDSGRAYHSDHTPMSRTVSELQLIGKEYRKYPNEIDAALKSAGSVSGDHWFRCKEKASFLWTEYDKNYRYNLKTDTTESANDVIRGTYYMGYAYFFTLEKKNGEYQLVLK